MAEAENRSIGRGNAESEHQAHRVPGAIETSRRKQEEKAFARAFLDNLYYVRGQAIQSASLSDVHATLAYTVRDHLVDRWQGTVETYYATNPKFVCYLSAEYLPGEQLSQNLLYTGLTDVARRALSGLGYDLDDLLALDVSPSLGNGGLGRLAACFLDSMATLGIPAIAYGIRYEYGIFRQTFSDGWQLEHPDSWLLEGNPWEFAHPDDIVAVQFGGRTRPYTDVQGRYRVRWDAGQHVLGEPYHMLVPGFRGGTVNMLRLWRARASQDFDFALFNDGDYTRAVEQKTHSENLSKVLYPNDRTAEGRALRLKQQYFFVACSMQDILRRFRIRNDDLRLLPEKAVIQLNDTHPAIAIPELMRILVDRHLLPWEEAWDVTQRTFAYTCHTLLPEALEVWRLDLFRQLLPRHLEIIYEINRRFLDEVQTRFPGDADRLRRMSLIEEGSEKRVRMAHLAVVGSFSVNGVAGLHTELLRTRVFLDFAEMWPEKFNNKTNGVTPRRFMRLANPRLSDLISSRIGDGWLTDLERLRELEPLADDEDFRRIWREVKFLNKRHLSRIVLGQTGLLIDPASLFDVLVKRLHEYKRQLLKALHIITLYNRIKAGRAAEVHPQTFVFGAKAAPGYHMAKLIIKLINDVAEVVNNDPDVGTRLRVVFLPDFNVPLGECIYPAADLSEQISLAGKEASGTGNMKLALNGAVTIGTLDGANIEIRERVGEENFFLFGLNADEVFAFREQGYRPLDVYERDEALRSAIDRIADGYFSRGNTERFHPLLEALLHRDEFLILADFASYAECHARAVRAYQDEDRWARMSILNTARCGYFSSDRTVRQYGEEIWNVTPLTVPAPTEPGEPARRARARA